MKHSAVILAGLLLATAAGIACGPGIEVAPTRRPPQVTVAPTFVPTPRPTATPSPTPAPTPTPTPTFTPTPTPAPTPTPVPTATATATPPPMPPGSPTPVPSGTPLLLDQIYVDESVGYSFAYPSDWTLEELPGSIPGQTFVQVSHSLGTNITVEIDRLTGVTFEEFMAVVGVNFGRQLSSYAELSRSPIDSPPGYMIEAEATVDGLRMPIHIIATQSGDTYLLAATFVADFLEEVHGPTLDAMLASFTVFEPGDAMATSHEPTGTLRY